MSENNASSHKSIAERLLRKRKGRTAFAASESLAKKAIAKSVDPSGRLPDSGRLPGGDRKRKISYLVDESRAMEIKRRRQEHIGHSKFARVIEKEHSLDEPPAPEGELQNSIRQHPDLDRQIYDGTDPNLNPEPPLSSAARREFDNQRREQEMEKQLRLGNMPKFGKHNTPKPGY
ncbi:hypothetical protein ACFORL_03590 [Legionella dresdenensis]|uniref:Smr domain protein n=1 Tax=Legionella dresdenensis TaxID=450200 RepID=A0ABV8CD65_9GAMM